MPQETKNIIQLKESTSGPNFYPETHKAAIVGKETYSYLGEVVSPGGGGGGSTGGDKPLSVSPRQSVIVGKCIPVHPRKGKKYYFADGLIKVRRANCFEFYSYADDPITANPIISLESSTSTTTYNITELYTSGVYDSSRMAVVVEITREWIFDTFDLQQCNIHPAYYENKETESPKLEIINKHIRNISSPELWRYAVFTTGSEGGTPVILYNFGRALFNNKLLAVKYKRRWGEHLKHIKCLVVQPKWLTSKLLAYKRNNWVGKSGNKVPSTIRWSKNKIQNGIPYFNMSGRVYVYSIKRRRVGNLSVIVHFTKRGNLRYTNAFRVEKPF